MKDCKDCAKLKLEVEALEEQLEQNDKELDSLVKLVGELSELIVLTSEVIRNKLDA